MDQHPVPQNISSYEFRLVGDMTLKQFFQIAGGIIIAAIVWRAPLPLIIKGPISGTSILTGILLAFVPIQGRPFSVWLLAFFKAVYSPTIFNWIASKSLSSPTNPSTEHQTPSPSGPLDQLENQLLSRFNTLFSQATQIISPKSQPQSTAPTLQIPTPIQTEAEVLRDLAPTTPQNPINVQVEIPAFGTTTHAFVPLSQHIPTPQTPQSVPAVLQTTTNPSPATPPASSPDYSQSALIPTSVQSITRQTLFDSSLPIPTASPAPTNLISPPSYPNIVSGVVVDKMGKSLEGVIIEVIDNRTGLPVRAFRTNKLGQFQTATPLTPGPYTISAEKESFTFTSVSIQINNTIISPILITAT